MSPASTSAPTAHSRTHATPAARVGGRRRRGDARDSHRTSTTKAWAIDAASEVLLAAELTKIGGSLRVLHDRRAPGTRGYIDHLVVAPTRVFVVDAKANRGSIAINHRGWFLWPDYRLTVAGRDCSAMADRIYDPRALPQATWLITQRELQ